MRRYSTVMFLVMLLASGCGGEEAKPTAEQPKADQTCVILANGNKLCGADAKAYCERFAQDSVDAQTRGACQAVGADTTSDAADARAAEEEEEEKEASANRAKILAADDLRPGVKRLIPPDDLLAVERAGDTVTVDTFYVQGESFSDTDRPAPSAAKLRKVCAGVLRLDPTIATAIVAGDGDPLETCERGS